MTSASSMQAKTSRASEPQRYSGIARRPAGAPASRPLLERITLLVEGHEEGRIERFAPFDLDVGDDVRVRTEIGEQLAIEPVTSQRGRWTDFADDPSLAELARHVPHPRVRVELRSERVDEGARVEVLAEEVEHGFDERGGHRSAPERRVVRITARAVASGDEPDLAMDRILADLGSNDTPKKKRRRDARSSRAVTWLGGRLCAAMAAVAIVGVAAVPFSPLMVDLAVLGIGALTLWLTLWMLRRVPRFVGGQRGVPDVEKRRTYHLLIVAAFVTFVVWAPPFIADFNARWNVHSPGEPAVNGSPACCFALIVFALMLVVAVLMLSLRSAKLLRRLLAATPISSGPVRAWGSFEGTVRDPTPVSAEGQLAAVIHIVDETVTEGSDPNIFVQRVLSKGTFFVDRSGTSFEIDPSGASWASAVTAHLQGKDARRRREKQVVPVGGSVLVAGPLVREGDAKSGKLEATGNAPLVFFAAGRGKSARAAARRLLWLWRGTVVAILACGFAGVALAAYVEPHLPPFHMPHND